MYASNGTIERTLRNLSILASVTLNDKLMTTGDYFVIYNPSAFRALLRMVYGENREMNITRIGECVASAQSFITTALSEQLTGHALLDTPGNLAMTLHHKRQLNLCKRMLEYLENAMRGVDNLRKTYSDDAATSAKIIMVQQGVADFLSNMQSIALVSEASSPVLAALSHVRREQE